MSVFQLATAALCLAACLQADPAPVTLHVATDGSDSSSGKLDAPFATVERARDAAREVKRKQPVIVYIHGGTYTLARPLRFGPEDSGSAECPIVYAAYRDERPVLSGGRVIGGWKEVTVEGKRLWAAGIPAVREGKWYFRQLWINGGRRTRARNPNQGFYRLAGVPDLDLAKPYQAGNERIQFAPGEITHWKDAEIVFMTFWISSRRRITGVDEAQRIATLDRRTTMRLTDGFGKTPQLARYYVENAMGLLDMPGEWYLDRLTGMVYYMPLPGEKIENVEAIAPLLDQLLILDGKPKEDRRVEHLSFRGLTFEHAEFWLPEQDHGDQFQRQAAAPMPGAIQLTGARRCSFTQCAIAHVSSSAIHFSRGCDHDQLTNSKLFDLGAGGVKVGDTDRIGNVPPGMTSPFSEDPREETHDIEISDNDIREGGRVFHQGHGILVGQSYNNLISHNHVHDFYQHGISIGWTWGYGKSLARNNVVEYNHIHLIGQGWLSDLAGVYTLGIQPGTVIRNNLIHDVECSDYVGRGIYLDEGRTGIVLENNVVYRTSTGGFGMNFGKNNIIRNNIFAFGERSQIEPVGNMPRAPAGSGYVLERNIFLLKKGENVLRGNWQPKPTDNLVIRGNLYWNEGGDVRFGSRTLAEWQAAGLDAGSLIADPLFADTESGNFKLSPRSPALKIGFQPIDLSGVGPHAAARKALAAE